MSDTNPAETGRVLWQWCTVHNTMAPPRDSHCLKAPHWPLNLLKQHRCDLRPLLIDSTGGTP